MNKILLAVITFAAFLFGAPSWAGYCSDQSGIERSDCLQKVIKTKTAELVQVVTAAAQQVGQDPTMPSDKRDAWAKLMQQDLKTWTDLSRNDCDNTIPYLWYGAASGTGVNNAVMDCAIDRIEDRIRYYNTVYSLGKQAAAPVSCLKDGETVALTGSLSHETFPGRPNYQSIDNGDEPERVWILTISSPRCVVASSPEDGSSYEAAHSATRFQLSFENTAAARVEKALVEKGATVTGQIFVGTTGHHHTKALVSVKTINTAR